jgi:transposase-like protein
MKSIVRLDGKDKRGCPAPAAAVAAAAGLEALNSRVEMIQALIPVGLAAVNDLLQQEVTALAGPRYQRGGGVPGYDRWGSQSGSVYLADQKVAVTVPRVRDVHRDQEVPLSTYQGLRVPRRADEAALRKILKGLSCRDYEACVDPVAETFGLAASSRKLAELQERNLSGDDLVGLFLDGKTFGADEMVIALGVTLSGDKVLLGFVQTATENAAVCTRFLRSLVDRGLKFEQGLLVVIDGAKGLRQAVNHAFGKQAAVQRCQWHKRQNVLRYLATGLQPVFERKLQAAYEQPTYGAAKRALLQIRADLARLNASAAASLDEGLEETLTLHRLGLFKLLGRSFKTTNCIENLNALVGQWTDKVDCWRNADQKHRWLATTLLELEPRLRKVSGYAHLPQLRAALDAHTKGTLEQVA